ncbi:hypothetical protein ABQF39_30425 [Mycobacterium syngnathidarum]
MDNGPEFISQVLQQFCDGKTGTHIPPGTPWNNGRNRNLQQPTTQGAPQPKPLEHPAGGSMVIGNFKTEHNTRLRHSALGYRMPAEYSAVCRRRFQRPASIWLLR